MNSQSTSHPPRQWIWSTLTIGLLLTVFAVEKLAAHFVLPMALKLAMGGGVVVAAVILLFGLRGTASKLLQKVGDAPPIDSKDGLLKGILGMGSSLWAVVFVLSCLAATLAIRHFDLPQAAGLFAAIFPLASGAMLLASLLKEPVGTDELISKLRRESLCFAFVAMLGAIGAMGLLQQLHVVRSFSWNTPGLLLLMFAFWFLGAAFYCRRYS